MSMPNTVPYIVVPADEEVLPYAAVQVEASVYGQQWGSEPRVHLIRGRGRHLGLTAGILKDKHGNCSTSMLNLISVGVLKGRIPIPGDYLGLVFVAEGRLASAGATPMPGRMLYTAAGDTEVILIRDQATNRVSVYQDEEELHGWDGEDLALCRLLALVCEHRHVYGEVHLDGR